MPRLLPAPGSLRGLQAARPAHELAVDLARGRRPERISDQGALLILDAMVMALAAERHATREQMHARHTDMQ